MNPFEGKNIQCSRNDATDSAVGFGVSFGMFTLMFLIAIIVEVASR
ncbi:membrane protein [Lysinibacillus sphaericus]|nr:YqzM family protein [Lysinibacillus sphaericus]MBG9452693.1 membrane protein [Lysinibacillus sphaericus]MBG9479839.1 membrane protein [Lysinibacillus sphaericus]MBG9595242.1 membrane protein [Lysinibacillus sphaericus]